MYALVCNRCVTVYGLCMKQCGVWSVTVWALLCNSVGPNVSNSTWPYNIVSSMKLDHVTQIK